MLVQVLDLVDVLGSFGTLFVVPLVLHEGWSEIPRLCGKFFFDSFCWIFGENESKTKRKWRKPPPKRIDIIQATLLDCSPESRMRSKIAES